MFRKLFKRKHTKHSAETKRKEYYGRMYTYSRAGNLDECIKVLNECNISDRGQLGNMALCELLVYCHKSAFSYRCSNQDTGVVSMLLNNGADPTLYYPSVGYHLCRNYAPSIAATLDTISAESWLMILKNCAEKWDDNSKKLIIGDILNATALIRNMDRLNLVYTNCSLYLSEDNHSEILSKAVSSAVASDNLYYLKLLLNRLGGGVRRVLEDNMPQAFAYCNGRTVIIKYLLRYASRECSDHFQKIAADGLIYVLKSSYLRDIDRQALYAATLLQANCDNKLVDYASIVREQMKQVPFRVYITKDQLVTMQMLHVLGSDVFRKMELTEEDLVLVADAEERNKMIHMTNEPISLKGHCRLNVRAYLGGGFLWKVDTLPVPTQIVDYLMMREFGGLL